MLSGIEVQTSIERTLHQALGEANAVDAELGALTERLVRLREQEGEAYRELARLRLATGGEGGLTAGIAAAVERARGLLVQRSDAVKAIDADIARNETERAKIVAERNGLLARVEERSKALADAERATLETLAGTEAYRRHQAEAEAADKVARHAEQKTEFAEGDRTDKGKPYEADPLFIYLWQRGYGTPAYEGGMVGRWLDRRVARLVGYDKARANYAMLQEIPKRLHEHAERCRADANAALAKLDALEDAAVREGEAGERRRALDEAQAQLDAVDDRLAAVDAGRTAILQRRALVTGGDDAETRQALEGIVAAIKRTDVRALRDEARRTPMAEDDAVVARLADIEDDVRSTEDELKRQKVQQIAQRQRLSELEQMRQEYRSRGYGRSAFDFGSADMLSVLLGQVLGGGLGRDGFWEQMNRRRVSGGPGPFDLGGGMDMPRMPRFPGGFGGGGGMPRMPRAPRGGFGGGGFRTGGSF